MVTHSIVLLLLLNGSVTYCNHKVRAFSSEGMQAVSWAISSVALYRIMNTKSNKFPWLLRAWWFCSFILSIISVAVDTHYQLTYHSQLRLQDYADFLSVLASTCLFAISVHGKTCSLQDRLVSLLTENGNTKDDLRLPTDDSLLTQTSLQLGSKLLKGFGVMSDDVNFLRQIVRDSMELQAQDVVSKRDDQELNGLKPLQVRVAGLIDGPSSEDNSWEVNKVGARASIQTIQQNVDEAQHDKELQQSSHTENEEVANGNVDTKNGFPVPSQDVEGKIDV